MTNISDTIKSLHTRNTPLTPHPHITVDLQSFSITLRYIYERAGHSVPPRYILQRREYYIIIPKSIHIQSLERGHRRNIERETEVTRKRVFWVNICRKEYWSELYCTNDIIVTLPIQKYTLQVSNHIRNLFRIDKSPERRCKYKFNVCYASRIKCRDLTK